jgi:hypothetical protein
VSKFKVGDRVRIVGALAGNWVGMTATVSGPLECFPSTVGTIEYGHDVSVDGVGSTYNGKQIARRPCDMVLLRDDRPELTTWEAVRASCGWMPGTVRA